MSSTVEGSTMAFIETCSNKPSCCGSPHEDMKNVLARAADETRGDSIGRNVDSPNSSVREDESVSVVSLLGGDKRQKKIVFRDFSTDPFEVLSGVVMDIPKPSTANDAVVKVVASSVSYKDCMMRRGITFGSSSLLFPATPGSDVVGNIVEIGSNCKKFKVGDRVAALVQSGGNARYAVLSEDSLVSVPRSLDSGEAASMISTYMTAYQSLRMVTDDSFSLKGKRVLITGGIEPVGQALIQLCFRAGADEVVATAPSNRHRYMRSILGATPVLEEPERWIGKLKGSMDVVFDSTCDDCLNATRSAVKSGGTLVFLGMSKLLNKEGAGVLGAPITAYWAKLKGACISKSYDVWDSFQSDKDAYKLDLEILFHLLKKKFIKPHVAKRVSLAEIAEAQQSLENETARGQIIVLPWKRMAKK